MKEQITQKLADELQPGMRDLFIWDATLPGFGLKVTPAGRLIYIFQYRLGGRSAPTKRITIGSEAEGWTANKARSHAQALSDAAAIGQLPSPPSNAVEAPEASQRLRGLPIDTWQIRLGFLASDLSRLQSTLLRRGMKRLSASHAQWGMLGQLALHRGVTQMELAGIMGLSKVAVTGLVNRLVRAGWVERRLDDRDKRVRRLYLMPEAKRAVAAMREEVDVVVAQSMGHIPDMQGEELVQVLEGIKERLLQLGKSARRRQTATA